MAKTLSFGVVSAGIHHKRPDGIDVDTKFKMVRDSGVFDYFDVTPPVDQISEYAKASAKYNIPISAGGFYYQLGQDEVLLKQHIENCHLLGTQVHNIQILADNATMKRVTDTEIASFYIETAKAGQKYGVAPCFEVHVNMWSENFGRVKKVADLVEAQGVKFNMTLDPSHIIFKIDNPDEILIQNMDRDIANGDVVLDPFHADNICQKWITAGYVRHAHARSAVPNGPRNIWAKHPGGNLGRAIQYPFIRPGKGEWHSKWNEEKLEPWKEVFRQLFRHHARTASSTLTMVSTEFIPYPDYGGGAKYSLFEQNLACAEWLRKTWSQELLAANASGIDSI